MLDKSEMDQVILATGGYDHTIKLWQTHSGICYRTMQHTESQVNALEITPDRQLLASATYQHIFMYDLNSNNPNAIVNYEVPSKNITDIGFQIDGRWMYSGGEDCRVRLWDLKSKSTQCPKMFEIQTPVNCVCLHPNQVELFVGDLSGVIHKWDLKTDHNEQIIYGTTPEKDTMIVDVAIDPTGSMMAAVNNRGQCFVWHLTTGHMMDEPTKLEQSQTFVAHNRHGLCCEFSPDSKYLITTSADQTAKIWETQQFELVQELKQDGQRWVWDAAFSSDSQYVFTASSDGYAKLWNIETGNVEKEYAGHQKAVTALAFKDCAV